MAGATEQILAELAAAFPRDAKLEIYRAPGRVNLIGEHTDYNLGFVFPIALEMACYVGVERTADSKLRIYSRDFDEEFTFDVRELPNARPRQSWSDYVVGVAKELSAYGVSISGANFRIQSEVPIGAGLSSSAAIEISTALAFLGTQNIDPLQLTLLAQRSDTNFLGIPSGIMDQYASVFGRTGSAIQIDCRSLQHEYVPLPENLSIVAVNSMVKHEHGTSAYRDRVAECQAAVSAIQRFAPDVKSLRDVSLEQFRELESHIPPVPRRRAQHVISENQRVLDFAAAARAHNVVEMGRLAVESHRSLQHDYEVSCEEVDFLVDTALQIPGVYGARITGGGFGGCTVNLLAPDSIGSFQEQISKLYKSHYGKDAVFYNCQPADGASRIV